MLRDLVPAARSAQIGQMAIEFHHHMSPTVDNMSECLAILERHGFGYQLTGSGVHADHEGTVPGRAGARLSEVERAGCATASALAPGGEGLGDSAGAGEAIQGEQAAVMEQQHSVGDVTHTRELVGRDDRRRRGALAARERRAVAERRDVGAADLDEEQLVLAGTELVLLLRSDQYRNQVGLDCSGVGPPQAGEAIQERRGAGARCSEHGEAFAPLDVQARAAKDPCTRRASFDAGGVALPESASAKGERHPRTIRDLASRYAITPPPVGRKGCASSCAERAPRHHWRRPPTGGRSSPGGAVQLEKTHQTGIETPLSAGEADPPEATRLSELSPQQWQSGTAAWLGWLFDGLDMHLYTLVAAPVVLQLIGAVSNADPGVKEKSAYIQAAFLLGWALGGAFFGRLGDILGRSRALSLTILTYAICTGLCAFAQTWWQLMLFRFVAALGIGGEWAVGASLLSETWPKAWRPWIAAMLQTGVNLGILGAAIAVGLLSLVLPPETERYVFLVGVLPAFLVFWIRRHVPEPETWERERARAEARAARARPVPGQRRDHHAAHDDDVRAGALGLVAVPVLAVAAPAPPARRRGHRGGRGHADRLGVVLRAERDGDRGQLLRGLARAHDRKPAGDRRLPRRARSGDPGGVHRAAEHQLARVLLVPAGGLLLRRVRAVHDVPAAALPDPAAHDGRGVLLQHRPHRGSGRARSCSDCTRQ